MSKQIQDAYIVTADPQEDLGNVIVGLAAALGVFAIGVGASWVLATMVYDGYRAQKWVGVEGTANWFGTGRVAYQYKFGDVQYFGDRLDPNPTIFTSSIDSPPADHAPMRPPTYRDDTPVAIWVNPDNPSESMMNRNVPWGFAIVTTLFALTFGVGGFAATWALSRKIFGRREAGGAGDASRAHERSRRDSPRRGEVREALSGARARVAEMGGKHAARPARARNACA